MVLFLVCVRRAHFEVHDLVLVSDAEQRLDGVKQRVTEPGLVIVYCAPAAAGPDL